MFLENPTFLCGHRKSGTTMLLGLLESHPELLVYPPDSGFFYGYYPKYDSDKFSDQEKVDRMVDFVIEENLGYEIDKVFGKNNIASDFSMEDFKNKFRELIADKEKTPGNMLSTLMEAYRYSFTGSENAKRWVEKTTSTEIYALDVWKWFPNAKFIHVIRDPRDNWASLKSGWLSRYKNYNDELQRLMQSMIERGKLGLEFALKNQEVIGKEQYMLAKFEDITSNPEEVLPQICDFLGISYDPILQVPTVLGKLWDGNNFDGLKFKKPSNVNVGKWKERITDDDAKLIEFYFRDVMQAFDYKLEFPMQECMKAASDHYKWHNNAKVYA